MAAVAAGVLMSLVPRVMHILSMHLLTRVVALSPAFCDLKGTDGLKAGWRLAVMLYMIYIRTWLL